MGAGYDPAEEGIGLLTGFQDRCNLHFCQPTRKQSAKTIDLVPRASWSHRWPLPVNRVRRRWLPGPRYNVLASYRDVHFKHDRLRRPQMHPKSPDYVAGSTFQCCASGAPACLLHYSNDWCSLAPHFSVAPPGYLPYGLPGVLLHPRPLEPVAEIESAALAYLQRVHVAAWKWPAHYRLEPQAGIEPA